MVSTNNILKTKSAGFGAKSGSSAGSDKDMNGKLKRSKIRRPSKMNDYGTKRIPDYTELAYKEAVSKLRYFLSGNYAPSIRSYGGSASIKNLDESDGEIDKKYSPSYNTLSEYRPRPKLTAKYATLYADSLNNYTPPTRNNGVGSGTAGAAPPSSEAAGTSPDVINFIQKQEEYIEQLERESQYCRDELNNLLGKVKEVISENENLHEAQKNKLITRMFHSYSAGSETDDLDDLPDSTGLDSDNKATPSKARKPSKSRSIKLEGPNIVFESRIAELEAQLTQAKIDLKKVQDENNENKRKLASGLVDSTCLDGFKRQIDNLQRDKSSLEGQISKLKLSLDQREDDPGRYKRSDAVEQQLRDERNNLETEVRRLKDDLTKERNKVREVAGEGARRALNERSAAEQRYNAHFDELQHDLAAQYDNVSKLQLDLERQRREENELKRELSMRNSAIEELKMELKNKTASLQADLAQAHAEKASLDEELAAARLAIERHQRQAKHDTNRLNSEIQSLRQRLDRADADLVHSRRENLRLSEQISTLEKELNMKILTPISPEKNKKEKELSTMFESMENKHAKTVAELESMIQSQNSLMEKLTGECRLLTDKLDDANRRHKKELVSLQRQVETLGQSMKQSHVTPSANQAPSTYQTTANRNVPNTISNTGRIDPGTESTGHSDISGYTDRPVTDFGEDEQQRNNDKTGAIVEDSTMSLTSEHNEVPIEMDKMENNEEYLNDNTEPHTEHEKVDNVKDALETEYTEQEAMEIEAHQEPVQDTQNYNYDTNYEQNKDNTEYESQYEQNYEQPAYSDEQYQNYEQYPQQYPDQNAQYDEQYNYTSENYEEQNNDKAQYPHDSSEYPQENAQYQEYPQDTEQYQEEQQSEEVESKSQAPKDELPSQS